MRPILIVHGGAGAMPTMTERREARYRVALREATAEGAQVLRRGGSAREAVVAANLAMEDSGAFNAGLGSCLTSDGTVEMDAAIMEAEGRRVGAVAGIVGVAHPILAAERVMTETRHAILQGEGATLFARAQGLHFREGFPSEARLRQWRDRKAALASGMEEQAVAALGGVLGDDEPVGKGDTVGAVALDERGRLAAGVSTGGIWMKQPGRVGDSPLPGAGLWADERGASVATGTGESILRILMCKEAVDAMGSAQAGCEAAVALLERHFGPGQGGVIGLDARGRAGFALNTRGMGRALWHGGLTEAAVAVWPDEGWDREVAEDALSR
jgi:beta-aspartyl-peptidase (threonine type)